MKLRIDKIPIAILVFIGGVVFGYIMFGFGDDSLLPVLLDVFESLNLMDASTLTTIKLIAWAGVYIITIISVIIMPLYLLTEGEEQ